VVSPAGGRKCWIGIKFAYCCEGVTCDCWKGRDRELGGNYDTAERMLKFKGQSLRGLVSDDSVGR
jgi:hypothetical protein